ncbi:MAG: hypothetical protein NTV70_13650 [Acidobacteria bacterium]|nr:hypothetical protein [Acidobacteriota bacterium]
MKVIEVPESPRLTKMESSLQSLGRGRKPSAPIEDTVDLSGEALRIIRDGRPDPDDSARQIQP